MSAVVTFQENDAVSTEAAPGHPAAEIPRKGSKSLPLRRSMVCRRVISGDWSFPGGVLRRKAQRPRRWGAGYGRGSRFQFPGSVKLAQAGGLVSSSMNLHEGCGVPWLEEVPCRARLVSPALSSGPGPAVPSIEQGTASHTLHAAHGLCM